MNINLKKLAKQVDEVFAKETKETLAKWLNERRAKRTEPVLNTPVVVDCTTCRWNEIKFTKPIKIWKPNLIQRWLIKLKIVKDKRHKPMTKGQMFLMDEIGQFPFTPEQFDAEWKKRS